MSEQGNPEPFEHPPIPWQYARENYDISNPKLVHNPEIGKYTYKDPIPVSLKDSLLQS